MRPRTLKVLYNILYEHVQDMVAKNNLTFICFCMMDLLSDRQGKEPRITNKEYDKLSKHFIKQYPSETNYVEFYNDNDFIKLSYELEESSWFTPNNRSIRIKFLEAILLKLK